MHEYEFHCKETRFDHKCSHLNRRLIGVVFLYGTVFAQSPSNAAARNPNVIIILTDDQGYVDVGVFGAKGFATPNLDRLAKEGIRFTDFHVAQPVCSASQAGLLTDCHPNRLGIHGALRPEAKIGLNTNEMTIAIYLQPKRTPCSPQRALETPPAASIPNSQRTTWRCRWHSIQICTSEPFRVRAL